MTDPRINPADTPGGAGPPETGGGRGSRHGLFHRGSSGSSPASTGSSAVGTATRTTASTSVPQQSAQQQSAQQQSAAARPGPDYGPADEAQNMLAKAAKMSWMVVGLGALVMIGLGICLLVWPHASLTVVAVLIGCAIIASGLVKLYTGFTARGGESGGMRAAFIVLGLVSIIVGMYCLRHHSLSLFLVAFVAGVYFIMHGIADIGAAASAPGPGRGLRAVLGIFSIAAGLILVVWPSITLVLLLTIMAAWLLFYGVALGVLAFGLRRAAKSVTRPGTSTTMAKPARAA